MMDQKGEFVLYADEMVLWQTDSSRKGFMIEMQNDGNLVLSDANGNNVWSSETQGRGEYLICQDDGNIVMFDYQGDSVWKTNTVQSMSFNSFIKVFTRIY